MRRAALGVLAVLLTAAACGSPGSTAPTSSGTAPPASSAASATTSPAPVSSTRPTASSPASSTRPTASSPASSTRPTSDDPGTDTEVTFAVGGVTVHGSLRRPVGASGPVPAAVLLAGSGPTDRNGNSALTTVRYDTLSNLAAALARDGVASLRYDKIGTGATGIGSYATHPADIGFDVVQDEARAALAFLARQSGVDPTRLLLVGHSEGGLVALSVAARPASGQPRLAGLGLLESPGSRFLDLLQAQLLARLPALVRAGTVTSGDANDATAALPTIISTLRTTGKVPLFVPGLLVQNGLTATNARYLSQEDALDPPTLARALPAGLRVLLTCSTQDIQVSCADVGKVVAAVPAATATVVRLTAADHDLRELPAGTDPDTAPTRSGLPFSTQLTSALVSWSARF